MCCFGAQSRRRVLRFKCTWRSEGRKCVQHDTTELMIDVMLGFYGSLAARDGSSLVGKLSLPTWGQQYPDVRTTLIWCHKSEVANEQLTADTR